MCATELTLGHLGDDRRGGFSALGHCGANEFWALEGADYEINT
jgi:hypothetical protein